MDSAVAKSKFEQYLVDGEEILWTGKPNNEFFKSDKGTVKGNMFLIAFAIFVEMILIKGSIDNFNKYGELYWGFVLMFFVCLLLIIHSVYLILDVTLVRARIWENTMYSITNKRILVVIDKSDDYEEIIEENIDEITSINIADMSLNQPGIGSIIFGEIPFKPAYVRNNDRQNARKNSYINGSIIFNNIEDVCGVFVLVNKLITEK